MRKPARNKGALCEHPRISAIFKLASAFGIIRFENTRQRHYSVRASATECCCIPHDAIFDEDDFETFEESEFPLAYLLTFRTFGTWFHGDERLSVGRDGRNHYGRPRIKPRPDLEAAMMEEASQPPVILTKAMRKTVEAAIKDLCDRRGYILKAVNVRSNHAHAVVSAQTKPERLVDALKANATKMLREQLLVSSDAKVWSRGRSRRYLWKPRHVAAAIDYVLYGQGDLPFEIDADR